MPWVEYSVNITGNIHGVSKGGFTIATKWPT